MTSQTPVIRTVVQGDSPGMWTMSKDTWAISVLDAFAEIGEEETLCMASFPLSTSDELTELLPEEFKIRLWSENASNYQCYADDGNGNFLSIARDEDDENMSIQIASRMGFEECRRLVKHFQETAKPIPPKAENKVPIRFWAVSPNGVTARTRHLEVPTWAETKENYPSNAVQGLDDLVQWKTSPTTGGRLVLLHGPPGTGKTSAIRTLAREWKEWCSVHYVVDPDHFFEDAYYMMDVLMDQVHVPMGENRWRLIVVEDADEFLREDAKKKTGQSMSRLLNLCDGLVGQGLNVLMLLTTNEPLDKLHAAIIRPGRCLVNMNIGKFNEAEADVWRKSHDVAEKDTKATLAELYQEVRDRDNPQINVDQPRRPIGFAINR